MTHVNKYCIINTDALCFGWVVTPKSIYFWQTTVPIKKMQRNKEEKDFKQKRKFSLYDLKVGKVLY